MYEYQLDRQTASKESLERVGSDDLKKSNDFVINRLKNQKMMKREIEHTMK